MSRLFLIIAEARDGKLRQVTLEALQAAKEASLEEDSIAAVLLGSELDSLARELAAYPLAAIYLLEDDSLHHYNPEAYLAALSTLLDELAPHAIFLGHTALGRDLAPAIAARLGAGQISDVIAIEIAEEVTFLRPVYAGKAIEKRSFHQAPWIVTIRPNNIAPATPKITETTKAIETTEALETTGAIKAIESTQIIKYPSTPSSASGQSLRTTVQQVISKLSGRVDLAEAKIIVSGGRGVKSAEGFKPLEELAELLGGAIGASRGACDAGYCDYSLQIGQTGKVVTPEIYIACGISGAIQHLAGMSGSRVIIAINKDPDAPIFKLADYGIVGDLFEVVPLLTQQFREALA